jgi:predicted aconitase with swiveling domain
MAKNTNDDHRIGSVNDRVQIFNPKTELWAKVDTNTGKIIDVKQDGKPFKGVAKFRDERRS